MTTLPKAELIEHIKEHTKYPATKKQIVDTCNRMSDVPKADREWFEENLPERIYKTVDEVMKAVRL